MEKEERLYQGPEYWSLEEWVAGQKCPHRAQGTGGIPSDFGQSLQSSYSCTGPPASCSIETGLPPSFSTSPTWALGEHHCSYTMLGACRAGGSEKPGPGSASVEPALTDPAMAAVGTYTWKDSPELGGPHHRYIHRLRKPESRLQLDYKAVLKLP